jgi:hypothetical protein
MPHYRLTIKLENKDVKEYIIEDPRKEIDFVYLDYRKRVHQKNGAGRVIYFDIVMIAEESLNHLEDRKEVFNEQNNFRVPEIPVPKKFKREPAKLMTLGERAKLKKP